MPSNRAEDPTGRSDEAIERDAVQALRRDERVQPAQAMAAVTNGIVLLSGWVDSYLKRWTAEEAVLHVPGVRGVANDLEVRLPVVSERSDVDIALAAGRSLEWDAFLGSERLKVTVSNGWITLWGQVHSEAQKEDAEQVVRRLTGVRGVTSSINVSPRPAVAAGEHAAT